MPGLAGSLTVGLLELFAGRIERLTTATARDWAARDPDLWAVVVAPWVLVQERVE